MEENDRRTDEKMDLLHRVWTTGGPSPTKRRVTDDTAFEEDEVTITVIFVEFVLITFHRCLWTLS